MLGDRAEKLIQSIPRPPMLRIFAFLLCCVCLISLVFLIFGETKSAISAFLGGAIFVIPQLYFSAKAFRYVGARAIPKIVQNFYKGESTKILLIALSFALVFKFYAAEVDHFALFFSFIATVIANMFVPAFVMSKDMPKQQ